MAEALASDAVPLVLGDDGVIRVEGTRVPLDTIVFAFQDGATAEEIAQQFPSISLADTYRAIGYYLAHRSEMERYLQRRTAQAAATQALNESRWPGTDIRERLLARRS